MKMSKWTALIVIGTVISAIGEIGNVIDKHSDKDETDE